MHTQNQDKDDTPWIHKNSNKLYVHSIWWNICMPWLSGQIYHDAYNTLEPRECVCTTIHMHAVCGKIPKVSWYEHILLGRWLKHSGGQNLRNYSKPHLLSHSKVMRSFLRSHAISHYSIFLLLALVQSRLLGCLFFKPRSSQVQIRHQHLENAKKASLCHVQKKWDDGEVTEYFAPTVQCLDV